MYMELEWKFMVSTVSGSNYEVYVTLKRTEFLKSLNKKELIKLKNESEGVLKLIASVRTRNDEYLPQKEFLTYCNVHTIFFENFDNSLKELTPFQMNLTKLYVLRSFVSNDNSYLILSSLLNSNSLQSNEIMNYVSDKFNFPKKGLNDMKFNLINTVLKSSPEDDLSLNLRYFLESKKYHLSKK